MKGITPVIAVILLLLITISLVGFSFVFLTRTTETTAESGEQELEQQLQQIGTRFIVENVDKNQVFIRNTGTTPLTNLKFFVNNVDVNYAGPTSLATNAVGTYFLNDSQLAMLPDPTTLRVTAAGASDEITADFYGNYDVGYWKFDEGSGNTVKDSSGNGNNGIIHGAVWTDGIRGGGLEFDGGLETYVDNGNDSIFNIDTTLTLEGWFKNKGPSPTRWQGIVSKWNYTPFDGVGHRSYWIGINPSNTLGFNRFNSSDVASSVSSTLPVNDSRWHHVVGVYGANSIKIYVDGSLNGTTPANGLLENSVTNVIIGNDANHGDPLGADPFNGTIDEVRILNIARSMTTA